MEDGGLECIQNRDPKQNRQLLIRATLDSIAEVGMAKTTVSAIIKRAGLSRGMIHLHFGGKDKLTAAAAEFFSDEYYIEMGRQLERNSGDPVDIILATIRADLSLVILNERSVAIWHGLRGAARHNPGISLYSDSRDKRLRNLLCDAFSELLGDEVQNESISVANEVTLGLLALLEGMWVDYMTHPNAFCRETAERIIVRFLDGIIPDRFNVATIKV